MPGKTVSVCWIGCHKESKLMSNEPITAILEAILGAETVDTRVLKLSVPVEELKQHIRRALARKRDTHTLTLDSTAWTNLLAALGYGRACAALEHETAMHACI